MERLARFRIGKPISADTVDTCRNAPACAVIRRYLPIFADICRYLPISADISPILAGPLCWGGPLFVKKFVKLKQITQT